MAKCSLYIGLWKNVRRFTIGQPSRSISTMLFMTGCVVS